VNLTLTLTTTAALRALADLIDHNPAGFQLVSAAPPTPAFPPLPAPGVTAEEKAAVVGKPTRAAKPAATAPSPPTAEAAPSKTAPSAAAPAPSTEPPAPAPSPATTAPDAPPFPYTDLQKVVIELHKRAPAKTAEIAAELGVKSFKELAPARWAEAKAAVEAAIAELSAAEVA
jgi:hypothetical protein